MRTPPDLSFLDLNGTPDPRAPGPPLPESQLPQSPQSGGKIGGSGDNHTKSKVNIEPPDISDPPTNFFQDRIVSPQIEKGYVNAQTPRNGEEILEAIRILADHDIEVLMPGETQATPMMQQSEDWRSMDTINQTFLRVLEKTGRATRAAEIAGMSRGNFTRRKDKDPAFARLWEKALKQRAELIEDEAMRRAVNGVSENIYYMGRVCGTKKVYSDALLGKLLDGNMPEKYRQNHKVEIEGQLGVATLILPATTSAEEWAAQNSGLIIDQAPEDEYS